MTPQEIASKYRLAVDRFLALTTYMSDDMRSRADTVGTWSIQNILAHLTYWDANNIKILEADAAGLPFSLDEGDVNARNAEVIESYRDMSWDDLVVEVTTRRDHRCQLHLRPSEIDYSGAGDHWDEHRAEITAWLASRTEVTPPNSLTPGEISRQYAERSQLVLGLIASVSEEQRHDPGVCGDWSLKDLMGHLAFWDAFTIEDNHRRLTGLPGSTDSGDVDELNRQQVELRRNLAWDQVIAEVHDNRVARIQLHLLPIEFDLTDVGRHWLVHLADIEAWLSDHTGGG